MQRMRSRPTRTRDETGLGRLRERARVLLSRQDPCEYSLRRSPVALYSEKHDFAVLFTAKAGCTLAVKWFFFQEGLLDEALAYSGWPHSYRIDVFIKQPGYMDKLDRVPTLGSRVLKFVRNPYDRAVSSYLHFSHILHDYPDGDQSPIVLAIGKHLGRRLTPDALFTFREFVDYLGAIDLKTCNPHFRTQMTVCERAGRLDGMTVIPIEDSARLVPEVETRLGLQQSGLAELRRSVHHTTRSDLEGFFGDTPFGRARGVPIPRSAAFYDDALLVEISRLYREDIEAYGYEPPSLAD